MVVKGHSQNASLNRAVVTLQRIVKRCVLLDLSTSKLPSTQQIFLELSKAHPFPATMFHPHILVKPILLKRVLPLHLNCQIFESWVVERKEEDCIKFHYKMNGLHLLLLVLIHSANKCYAEHLLCTRHLVWQWKHNSEQKQDTVIKMVALNLVGKDSY